MLSLILVFGGAQSQNFGLGRGLKGGGREFAPWRSPLMHFFNHLLMAGSCNPAARRRRVSCPMPEEAAIVVTELIKAFGPRKALDRVSFSVSRGEIFGYLGPNGAGKTTTIKIFAGLLPRDGGQINISGWDIAVDPLEVKKRIGVVPDEANLYPELSCQRNLDYMAELYGLRRRDRQPRVQDLINYFDLQERAQDCFGNLSRGLKRRLTIAAALIHEPEILFLDEPTSGLDVISARGLRALIRTISRRGVTVFLTTHNLQEAEELCQRLVILIRGRVAATGTPAAIRRQVQRLQLLEVAFGAAVSPKDLHQACPAIRRLQSTPAGWRLEVTTVQEGLEQVVAFSRRRNLPLTAVNTLIPSLEEAFLSLVQNEKQNEAP